MDSEHGKYKNFQMWYCTINGRKQNKVVPDVESISLMDCV